MTAEAEVAHRHQGRAAIFRQQAVVTPAEDPRFEQRALCSPDTAALFDERDVREPLGAYRHRRNQAWSLCRACPVQATCRSFGEANQLSGFIGGVELVHGRPQPISNPGRR